MSAGLDVALRSSQAYSLAARALEALKEAQIWPTPLNYEIWLHVVGEPEGALAQAVSRLLGSGESITETVSESLAAEFLPRLKINEEIRDAGDVLNQQLETVSRAIEVAQRSNEAYGRTLAGASRELDAERDAPEIKKLVEHLAGATRRVQRENSSLEKRLSDSTQEVRRLSEHLEQVRRDAMTDALTSLANRKCFDETLARACLEADEHGSVLSLAIIDIDHFKRFNDTWGHQTGDQVLRYVSSVIAKVGEAPRLAARYGGEEFGLLFPAEDAAAAHRALEAIRQEIGSRMLKRRTSNEDLGSVTVSAGLAQRRPGETASALMERADEQLYASKRGGRNRVSSGERQAAAA